MSQLQQRDLLSQIQQLEKIKREESAHLSQCLERKKEVMHMLQKAQQQLNNTEKLSDVLNDEFMSMDMKVRTEEGHIETLKESLNGLKAKNEELEGQVQKEQELFNFKRTETVKQISLWNQQMMECVKECSRELIETKIRQIQRRNGKLEEEIKRMEIKIKSEDSSAAEENIRLEREIAEAEEHIVKLRKDRAEKEVNEQNIAKEIASLRLEKEERDKAEKKRAMAASEERSKKKRKMENNSVKDAGSELIREIEAKKAATVREIETLRQEFESLDAQYTENAETMFPEAQQSAAQLTEMLASVKCTRCGGTCQLELD